MFEDGFNAPVPSASQHHGSLAGNTVAPVKAFDDIVVDFDFDFYLSLDQSVRYREVMPFERDVIVNIYPGFLPFGENTGFCR